MQQFCLELTEPGNPQQNAYIERYNGTVQHDMLRQYFFDTFDQVRKFATRWLRTYNHERLSMGNAGFSPRLNRPHVYAKRPSD